MGLSLNQLHIIRKHIYGFRFHICSNDSIKVLYIHSTSTNKDLASHFYYKIKNSPSLLKRGAIFIT
ncbi:hypothetical protein BAS3879 [Bacillus anthracis str. Sterne]|nr:hypothetical protein BAS3879 [Bacillus anthracis str. Sterne]